MSAAQEMPDFTAAYEALLSFDEDGDVRLTSTAEDQWRALDELRRAWGEPLPERLLRLERDEEGSAWLYAHADLLLGGAGARLYGCDCAERVLHIFERAHPGDLRPRRAIEVSRAYARGEATSEDLDAAWVAARDARNAAWAAGDAACDAGWAAWAAGDAACDAAGDTAWAAARATVGPAEHAWQIDHLVACVRSLESGAPWPTVEASL